MLTVTYFHTWYIMYQYCNKEIVKWHHSYLEGSENFSLNFSVLSKLLKEDCVFISMDNWDIWNEGQTLNRVLLQEYMYQQFITGNLTTTTTGRLVPWTHPYYSYWGNFTGLVTVYLCTFNESLLSFFSNVAEDSLLLYMWKWWVCTAAPWGSEM